MNLARIMRAAELAIREHARGKYPHRKYTGEPYAVHPASVAAMVAEIGGTEDMVCAAWLHDIVEDCPKVNVDLLERSFGTHVMLLIHGVTKVSREGEPRRTRIAADLAHYASGTAEMQTLKCADRIDNVRTVVMHGPEFAKIYMLETRDLLAALTRAHPELYGRLRKQVDEYFDMEARRGHSV